MGVLNQQWKQQRAGWWNGKDVVGGGDGDDDDDNQESQNISCTQLHCLRLWCYFLCPAKVPCCFKENTLNKKKYFNAKYDQLNICLLYTSRCV